MGIRIRRQLRCPGVSSNGDAMQSVHQRSIATWQGPELRHTLGISGKFLNTDPQNVRSQNWVRGKQIFLQAR